MPKLLWPPQIGICPEFDCSGLISAEQCRPIFSVKTGVLWLNYHFKTRQQRYKPQSVAWRGRPSSCVASCLHPRWASRRPVVSPSIWSWRRWRTDAHDVAGQQMALSARRWSLGWCSKCASVSEASCICNSNPDRCSFDNRNAVWCSGLDLRSGYLLEAHCRFEAHCRCQCWCFW